MGQPGPNGPDSTLVEYDASGAAVQSWQLTGKVDGLGADPRTDEVIATVNEDGKSSLYTIRLSRRSGGVVTHLHLLPGSRFRHVRRRVHGWRHGRGQRVPQRDHR
jgi:hypothetical protein